MIVQWPVEILPPQSAYMVFQVEKRMATAPITQGEPILLPKLLPLGVKIGPGPTLARKTVPSPENQGVRWLQTGKK